MENVVVGLENEALSRACIGWVIERARSKAIRVRLVTALDMGASSPDSAEQLLAGTARRIEDTAPGTQVQIVLAHGSLLHELLEESASADLIVIGSSPSPVIRESRTPSFPVSLAARSRCAVVVVPDNWEPRGGPVIVGVDAAGASHEAAVFAAHESADAGRDLEIVHTWEPWIALKTRTAKHEHEGILDSAVDRVRAEFPSLRVRGVLREAVAHDGIIASSGDASLIVLGTHRLGRETGLVLGAIHQEVMIRGVVPLCVVPLDTVPG